MRGLQPSGRSWFADRTRAAWRWWEPRLPRRLASAITAPLRAARRPRAVAPAARVVPHLTQDHDGRVVLVEGDRTRTVPATAAHALAHTLGAPRDVSDRLPTNGDTSDTVVELGVSGGLGALLTATPPGALVAVAGRCEPELLARAGRDVQSLGLEPPLGTSGDVGRGAGPLDELAIVRAHGATHLLVAASEQVWLGRQGDLLDFLARNASIAAVNDAGALWVLPPAPANGTAKVFVIGLGKTGTTSVSRALRQLGLRSFHWGGRAAYQAVLRAQRDDRRLLHYVGEHYDAYDDIETLSVRFDLADLQYPGSRFVLTVRDVDDWVASRAKHAQRNLRRRHEGTYGGSNVENNEGAWRAHWRAHVDRVTDWFSGRDDLLVIDVCAGEGWESLAPFLGRPVPRTPFPYENVADG